MQSVKTFTFNILEPFSEINHGIFTRQTGFSQNTYSSLNLSFNSGDEPEKVKKNRNIVAEFLKINSNKLFFPHQCHTANIQIVTHDTKLTDLDETDALICSEPGLAIGILAADCVPMLFYDAEKKIIAAAHAGWRGTIKKIGNYVLEKLITEFNSRPEDIYIGIGPAISQKNYEVGEEVLQEVNKISNLASDYISQSINTGHAFLNLQGLNKHLIEQAGIQGKNIEIMNFCTYDNPEYFFSARRDGFYSGRFGSVICLTK